MILREAKASDLAAAAPAIKAAAIAAGWTQAVVSAQQIKSQIAAGLRLMLAWDEGTLAAALGAVPFDTPDGKGYAIVLLLTNANHPDRLMVLDAICLYSCNIALSEGHTIVTSTRDGRVLTNAYYGRDHLGMEVSETSTRPDAAVPDLSQQGSAAAIVKAILNRRPEWALSL